MLPTLYKLTNANKIQTWEISYGDDGGIGHYTIKHGILNGKIQQTTTVVREGKNLGKINETTAPEQAENEARALWTKQRDRKGYSESIPTKKPFRPMLAQPYDKHKSKIVFPCLVQPKLDGIRCIIGPLPNGSILAMSRQGKYFTTLGHLVPELKPILDQGYVLDGELYNHSLKDNFQKLVSLIRRDKPVPESSIIQYHVYDIISDEDYSERSRIISSLLPSTNKLVLPVLTETAKSEQDIIDAHNRYVSNGYEGCIVRNTSGGYEINTRSYNLQKYKEFMTEEFELVGAEENKGKQEGQCSLILKTKDGKMFAAKPKGSDDERSEIWEKWLDNEIVDGDLVTVRFFGYTNDGLPRFPVALTIRNYE